jgi:hypothetical protein
MIISPPLSTFRKVKILLKDDQGIFKWVLLFLIGLVCILFIFRRYIYSHHLGNPKNVTGIKESNDEPPQSDGKEFTHLSKIVASPHFFSDELYRYKSK